MDSLNLDPLAANLMKTAKQKLQDLTNHFREMDTSDFRMDCLCLIAAGDDNAMDTLGRHETETEEFAALAIRSIECLLETGSDEVRAAFLALGYSN